MLQEAIFLVIGFFFACPKKISTEKSIILKTIKLIEVNHDILWFRLSENLMIAVHSAIRMGDYEKHQLRGKKKIKNLEL